VRRTASRVILVVVALATIGCDRATKYAAAQLLADSPDRFYAGDIIRVGYHENAGGFLSLGANLPKPARTAIFTVGTGVLLLALLVVGIRQGYAWPPAVGLVLFVAGGFSNWIDRVLRGNVVDFLNVGLGSLRTGVFNVADVAIMVGAGLLALDTLRRPGIQSGADGE
jgi:signal peptidase II